MLVILKWLKVVCLLKKEKTAKKRKQRRLQSHPLEDFQPMGKELNPFNKRKELKSNI